MDDALFPTTMMHSQILPDLAQGDIEQAALVRFLISKAQGKLLIVIVAHSRDVHARPECRRVASDAAATLRDPEKT